LGPLHVVDIRRAIVSHVIMVDNLGFSHIHTRTV
jgi:hypothetical protein